MEVMNIQNRVIDRLPDALKKAQNAIQNPEIQDAMKLLAKYNLGVFMPHKHNEENGDFEILPQNIVQCEDDLQVSFLSRNDAEKLNTIPVGWMWQGEGVSASAVCVSMCSVVEAPRGKEFHRKDHGRV